MKFSRKETDRGSLQARNVMSELRDLRLERGSVENEDKSWVQRHNKRLDRVVKKCMRKEETIVIEEKRMKHALVCDEH